MLGWTLLLVWASIRPLERRGVVLLTVPWWGCPAPRCSGARRWADERGRGPLRIGADPDARWIDRPTSEPTPSCVPVPEQARWSSSWSRI